jgi:2-polyprenyl-6-methoxyphenol hydroxylase-like FAD-dependent oxidoreductase
MRSMHVDDVIIGGGPAGSLAARGLALKGWRTVLIERGQRNRTKTCGHCLNPRGLRILDQHELLDAVRAIAVGSMGHLRVRASNGLPLTMSLSMNSIGSSPEHGLLTPRHLLDQILLDAAQAAGVDVLQPASARVDCEDDGTLTVTVRNGQFDGRLTANLVVGADGLGSAVARNAGLCQGAMVGRKFGFSFDSMGEQRRPSKDHSEAVDMIVTPDGYLGVVKQSDGSVHCAGLVSANSAESSREPMEFARRAIEHLHDDRDASIEEIDIQQITRFAATGPMPWRTTAVATSRVALVGDAAGYIEPFTGEGMGWALQSASLLLETLADREPGCWNQVLADEYERRWKSHIGRRQRTCRAVAFALATPRLQRFALGLARRCPAVSRKLVQWVHS